MKKTLLFFAILGIISFSFGQSHLNPVDGIREKVPVFDPDPSGIPSIAPVIGQKLDEAIIGDNWYDLQTYGSIGKRMVAYPDGTIGAAWMLGFETTDWSDRGTGYNYYDGQQWGPYPTARIESVRTGWPTYQPYGTNGEIVVSHYQNGTEWELLFDKRDNKGTGNWEEFSLAGPQTGVGIVWPAMVTSGSDHLTIHVLGRTYGDPYMGQDGALLYSRSTDGGATWDIQNYFFDDLDINYFTSIGADVYIWAEPKGSTIAFSVGFNQGPGYIMKSTDNGDNWEKIVVYESPFEPPPGGATPNFATGDGSQSLALDNNGNAHIVFGRMVRVYDETGAIFYYPATEGLIYWNETMPELDTGIISSYTLDYLKENGNLVGWITPFNGDSTVTNWGTYYNSLTSFPQLLIDENNRIFVIYSGVAAGFDNGSLNYRHIFGNYSADGGQTWKGIVDFTSGLLYTFSECVYPVLAPAILSSKLQFFFETDNEPGIFLWTAQQPQATLNNFTYMSVPVSVLTGTDQQAASTSQFTVSQNYPNPFTETTWIEADGTGNQKVTFSVYDPEGRQLYQKNYEPAENGKFRIRFDNPGFESGVYFYTVASGNNTFTGKMMVK